jgi:acetate kinase
MAAEELGSILTLNSGSSSLKFALYRMGRPETLVLCGSMKRIGLSTSTFDVAAAGKTLIEQPLALPDHDAALKALFSWLKDQTSVSRFDAVGHRVVHGGTQYARPQRITAELVASIQKITSLAPDHLPHELKAIEAVSRSYPALPQVACFDTAFHRQMPSLAQTYALPRRFGTEGIVRYGFHGLSYEYILSELRERTSSGVADGRVIIAHLGNGASMAAVCRGRSVDTTMGFTPAGGLMMSTRAGDLDPGVILYLLREKGLSPADVDATVNQQAGLLGVSQLSSDMTDLLQQETTNPHAAEAIALFCYQAKKFVAALTAVLGGLDTLVFTAGIGENAATIRWRICQDLAFLGIRVDHGRNESSAAVISADDSPVTVRVMKTNEELMIARHTHNLLQGMNPG